MLPINGSPLLMHARPWRILTAFLEVCEFRPTIGRLALRWRPSIPAVIGVPPKLSSLGPRCQALR